VEDNLNGTYDVAVIASSIYSGSNTDSVSTQVLVDKSQATHNPVITEALHFAGNPPCIINGNTYTVKVKAFDPDDDSLSYEWSRIGCGYLSYPDYPPKDSVFFNAYCQFSNEGGDTLMSIEAPPMVIIVNIRDPNGGFAQSSMEYHVGELEDCIIKGDANGDGIVNVGDVVYLIDYLFRGGPAPSFLVTGDVTCDGMINVGDVVYLITYLFKGGDPPGC